MTVCGDHHCPVCGAVFSHEVGADGMCFQAIGPMKWKTCERCFDELMGRSTQGKLAFGGSA